MIAKSKTPTESKVEMNELVLPEHTNLLNHLMGGKLMNWMDVCSFIVAQRHANRSVVTVSVDNVSFKNPIQLGNVVCLRAQVTRAFRSSMEIFVRVYSENMRSEEHFDSNSAFFTFVALDQNGHPTAVPELVPESDEERALYEGANRRRRLRLLLDKAKDESFDQILTSLEAGNSTP